MQWSAARLSRSSSPGGSSTLYAICTARRSSRLGLVASVLSTVIEITSSGIPWRSATVSMFVAMQTPSAAARRSVAEKDAPAPPYSGGRSVVRLAPDLVSTTRHDPTPSDIISIRDTASLQDGEPGGV